VAPRNRGRLAISQANGDEIAAVHKIIDEKLLRLALQPIVDMKSRKVFAYEALARSPLPIFAGPQELYAAAVRMDLVIENVLQLSRRRQAEPQLLDLKYWLHRFASEFRSSAKAGQTLHLETSGGSIQTRMDPHQLNQVLSNLVENGLRYSAKQNPQGQVWLKLFRDQDSDLPILEILDDGPGVAEEQLPHLFEPFYTTENKGTGLGLYISRELCESNQARLDYKLREAGGSCLRITFAHPRKLS
jgi:two-component system sensor histidine kinase PilS (NtrC family)